MNRLVKRNLPVTKLPKDWQAKLPKGARVSVDVRVEGSGATRNISSLVGTGRNVHGDEASVLAHIESMREDS